MRFTPAGCIGWFFAPIVNLWKPLQAVTEIWKASDPEVEGDGWYAGVQTPAIGVWWGTWLAGNMLDNVGSFGSTKSDHQGTEIVASVLAAVAAGALIVVMRGIAARQGKLVAKLARAEG